MSQLNLLDRPEVALAPPPAPEGFKLPTRDVGFNAFERLINRMREQLVSVHDWRELMYRLLFVRGFCEAHHETGHAGWLKLVDGDPLALDDLMRRIQRDVPRTPDERAAGARSRLTLDLDRQFDGWADARVLRAGLAAADRVWTEGRTQIAEMDVLGMAFEVISANAGLGQFFTPWSVASMIGRMNPAHPGSSVLDPACGSGRLLLAGLEHAYEQYGPLARTIWVLGFELDPMVAMIARWNMILAGHWQAMILTGNGLELDYGTVDVVWANPPFAG